MTARRIQASDPRRVALYVVSRGTVNETYYAAQKAARVFGESPRWSESTSTACSKTLSRSGQSKQRRISAETTPEANDHTVS